MAALLLLRRKLKHFESHSKRTHQLLGEATPPPRALLRLHRSLKPHFANRFKPMRSQPHPNRLYLHCRQIIDLEGQAPYDSRASCNNLRELLPIKTHQSGNRAICSTLLDHLHDKARSLALVRHLRVPLEILRTNMDSLALARHLHNPSCSISQPSRWTTMNRWNTLAPLHLLLHRLHIASCTMHLHQE